MQIVSSGFEPRHSFSAITLPMLAWMLYTIAKPDKLKAALIIVSIISVILTVQPLQLKKLFIGYHVTKEPSIGARVFSFKNQKCYYADLDGLVEFPILQGDSFQIEQIGYRLRNYSFDEMLKLDSAFLEDIGSVELGTNGIVPFLAADKYLALCKCCKY